MLRIVHHRRAPGAGGAEWATVRPARCRGCCGCLAAIPPARSYESRMPPPWAIPS